MSTTAVSGVKYLELLRYCLLDPSMLVLFWLLSPTDPLCTRYMEFVCKNRAQCLFQSLVCDGIKHCEDGSDEDTEYAGCGK